MPTYEMPLLLRIMKKPDIVATLKRTTGVIFNTGGFLRKMENWGAKELPCKINAHGHGYRQANEFCLYFDAPPSLVQHIFDECSRDVDIVRLKIYKQCASKNVECTFHEEMLPPPYRPSVQKMIERANKLYRNKYEFKYNSGLDYYPFTK